MPKDEIIVGLDLGSNVIRVAIGQKTVKEDRLQIIGVGEAPSDGVRKGVVVDIEDAVGSLSKALEAAERMTGMPVENAYVAIGSSEISSEISKGVVAVSKADGEITPDDVARSIDAAQAVAVPGNQEILHIIPRSFTVDNHEGVKDPVGMNGIRLEVAAHIIKGAATQVKNVTKVIYRAGVDINDFVLAPLAAASAVLSKRQRELGVVLIDIGGGTTDIAVFEEGDLLHTNILPIGGEHITRDINLGLRTSVDVAEKVKKEYGYAVPQEIESEAKIDLAKIDPNEEEVISRRMVAKIINARLKEIFEMVDAELKKIGKDGQLPAGAVITGGTAKLPGIIDVAKDALHLPVQIGFPHDYAQAIDKLDDPSFATVVGLVVWGADSQVHVGRSGIGGLSAVKNSVKGLQKWFKSLLP